MYDLYIKPYADKIFKKMTKKEKDTLQIINDKITEIRGNPNHEYKYLHTPLQGFNRAHIKRNFVLIFKIIHSEQKVEIWAYEHHDIVYKGNWLNQ
ncbi:MAG: addiction module toxin RelE [Candidatus Diapherotrites archaeon CG08_land_8_20_14_0_20_30_16]|nr:MAG: addiction module toxin RelE [Candidatus Diapherotrites archaeon CG08_land_8_20_14_0_20_30_16]